jgi:hypothetical protein
MNSEDLNKLLFAAAGVPDRPWESPSRYWSPLTFRQGRPPDNDSQAEFTAPLRRQRQLSGLVRQRSHSFRLNLDQPHPGILPVYLILVTDAEQSIDVMSCEDGMRRYKGSLQLLDLHGSIQEGYEIGAPDASCAQDLMSPSSRWILELEDTAPMSRGEFEAARGAGD